MDRGHTARARGRRHNPYGPILFTDSAGHGVHLGDLLAFAVAYAAALVITLSLLLGR